MTDRFPTRSGDALIISTDQSFHIYAVGRVSRDGQQSFHGEQDVQYVTTYDAAVAAGRTLQGKGRRTLLRDLDSGQWRQISEVKDCQDDPEAPDEARVSSPATNRRRSERR